MVLVDERFFEQQGWKQPIEDKVKSCISSNIETQLADVIPDDIKAKNYTQSLIRLRNTNNSIQPDEPLFLNGLKKAKSPPLRKSKRTPKRNIKWDAFY